VSTAPARRVWASTLRGGTAVAEALSPDGTRLFVLGYVGPSVKSETVAYSTATGAQLWAKTYPPENTGGPDEVIAVSADGAQVYVTGRSTGQGAVTVAYAAGTGRQSWVSHSKSVGLITGLAVSPDGTTVYETGTGRVSGKGSYIAVIAYDAATGQQRWMRYYTKVKPANGELGAVAVSPDGSTVYVDGDAGALLPSSFSLILLAYRATGTLKWATRYANRYTGGAYAGGAFGGRIVLGPGGRDLYVAGTVSSKYGHHVAATFAFRAATGTCLWVNPDTARGGEGGDAVTPDGRTVIAVGDRTGDAGGYRITSYNASTGTTRWARRAPGNAPNESAGLVVGPHGDTAFVASPGYGGGYDIAAWSVARGTVLWTTRYAAAKVYSPVAIAESGDGTRLFITGSVGSNGGMTTVAYQT
jgi:outer membrane protein assembly factor BamB